ncbi:hypothetical protein Nepgr_014102 [Nepenthes gracilis]|uniref:Uncharacterized protein n=1 Tax=Nepenthes gracilis TaxID=150966 RepID=A0AAD3SKE3_NEPGR|nr:hypothetical protein Nepgr_014102 [Nepenthes gracilis]
MAAADAPEFLLDKEWRPSEKERTANGSSTMRCCSRKGSSSKAPSILRSFSLKNSSATSELPFLSKSSSPHLRRSSSAKSSPPLDRSLSQKSSSFTKKCSTLAKEQKARFYIMKRCVAMLVCWRKDNDS